jgi:hypothetical protein
MINEIELMEWYRMSKAYFVRRYDRMLWASDQYCNKNTDIPSIRVYKALDHILSKNAA